jgi:hypothetical protein
LKLCFSINCTKINKYPKVIIITRGKFFKRKGGNEKIERKKERI